MTIDIDELLGRIEGGGPYSLAEVALAIRSLRARAHLCGHQHDMGFTCILPADHEGMHRGDIVWDRD